MDNYTIMLPRGFSDKYLTIIYAIMLHIECDWDTAVNMVLNNQNSKVIYIKES